MSNVKKMEQIIGDIEAMAANAKYRTFSNTDIIINKEDLDTMLMTLRRAIPDEVKQYQKIIANKENILSDAANRADRMMAEAEQKAQDLLNQAAVEHNQMISEHEVMLRAQARADEFVNMAMNKAQGIVDNATIEANNLKDAANQYMEDVLQHLVKVISATGNSVTANYNRSIQGMTESYEKLIGSLNEYQTMVEDNIKQLHPEEANAVPVQKQAPDETADEDQQ